MFKLPLSIITLTFWVLLSPSTLAQENASRVAGTASPLESESDHLGGLGRYGPVAVNDVTGTVQVRLPRLGPSPLLSVQPLVRVQLKDDGPLYLEDDHLKDNFYAMGTGGSMGWGHFMVVNPSFDHEILVAGQPMTYFQHGAGSPVPFIRDYLFQNRNNNPAQGNPELFTYQNTIDRQLRRMSWKDPNHSDPFLGDFVLSKPNGQKITFRRRIWNTANVNGASNRLYYPIRVENPNGESVAITYHFDGDNNQTHMMKTMEDNHGRTLKFLYEGPAVDGYLKEIRLFKPEEDPETDPGFLLASFSYTVNGLVDDNGLALKSLHTMTDAEGYVWELTWGTSNPAMALTQVKTPSQGIIQLKWESTNLQAGRFFNEPQRFVHSWRVKEVHMMATEETRIYGYDWETQSDPGHPNLLDGILQVTLTGEEGLSQVTRYQNMSSVYLQLEGESFLQIHYVDSGFPLWQQTAYNGAQTTRTWEYEPVFLWSTDFEPPANTTASGSPIENWVIRPKMTTLEKDGHTIDTHYTYGFSHPEDGNIEGNPGKAILAPTVTEQHLSGTNFKLRRDMDYENRVAIEGECHEYRGDDPYALSLPVSEETYYVKAPGVEELLGKSTTQYELAAFPFPTKIQQWATPSDAVETTFKYFTSGPNQGKLQKQYVAGNPDYGIENLEFTFGVPTKVQHPGLPDSEMELDFRGNAGSITEAGVTTGTLYDLIGRPKRMTQPTMLDGVTDYSEPSEPGMTAISYYENGAVQRQRNQATADEWHRPVLTEVDVSATQSGVDEVFYNGIGLAETTLSPTGSRQTAAYDVHGRPVLLQTWDAANTLIQSASVAYEGFSDGTTKVTETVDRDGMQTEKVTLSDFAGRVLETSFNKGQPGAGGSVFSEDYAGGGHTTFVTNYDAASGLTTTTIRPYGAINGSNRIEIHDLLGRVVSVRDAEFDSGRSLSYTYDARGLVCFSTHPDGKKYQYIYDDAGRLVEQRLRTHTDPEAFDLVVLRNHYHPVYGFLETQVKKLATQNTRVATQLQDPDALGRPLESENKMPEPLFWQPELERSRASHLTGGEFWIHQWRPLPDGSGLAAEYIMELKNRDQNRVSLYFPQIHQAGEWDPTVTFTLHNEDVLAAIDAQLTDHPDRETWLAEANRGNQLDTVLDPDQDYLFRVTGIDANYQASLPSYWWGDLPDLMVDAITVQMNGPDIALDVRIFNAGTRRAETSSAAIYLSQTPELPADAQPEEEWTIPAIDPGFAAFRSDPDIPVNGYAYVIIAVDSGHAVTELNENNNLGRQFLAHIGEHDPEKPDVVVSG